MLYLHPPATFIALEGIDRAGKGDIVKALEVVLEWNGIPHFMTYEPYDAEENPRGYETRLILKGELPNPGFEKLQKNYFVPARMWHGENKIMPALQEGRVVISDRYWESTLVFGKVSGNILYEEVLSWHEECIYPTLTIIIDISAEESIRRHEAEVAIKGREGDIFDEEGVKKQDARRKAYLELAEIGKPYMPNVEIINGERSRKEVLIDVLETVSSHLSEQCSHNLGGNLDITANNSLIKLHLKP